MLTKDELVQYLRVCADLADGPKDGIAHVAIVPLRQAIELLESRDEPSGNVEVVKLPDPPYKLLGDSGQIECPMCCGEGRVSPPPNRT